MLTILELTSLVSYCFYPACLYWLILDCYSLLIIKSPSGTNQKLARGWVWFLSEDADLIKWSCRSILSQLSISKILKNVDVTFVKHIILKGKLKGYRSYVNTGFSIFPKGASFPLHSNFSDLFLKKWMFLEVEVSGLPKKQKFSVLTSSEFLWNQLRSCSSCRCVTYITLILCHQC